MLANVISPGKDASSFFFFPPLDLITTLLGFFIHKTPEAKDTCKRDITVPMQGRKTIYFIS